MNIWQILKNDLFLQGYRRGAQNNGFVQALGKGYGCKTVGGGFAGARTRLDHGDAILIRRQAARDLGNHLTLTASGLKVPGRKPGAVGGLNFVFNGVGQGGHSAAL